MNSIAKSLSKLGDKNPQWQGDNAKYEAIHAYVRSHKPKPERCELCHKTTTVLDLANYHPTGEYTRQVSMYKYLCRLCHMTEDGRIKRFYSSELQRELNKAAMKVIKAKAKARATSKNKLQRRPAN